MSQRNEMMAARLARMMASRRFLRSVAASGLLTFFNSLVFAQQISAVVFEIVVHDLSRSPISPPTGCLQSCKEPHPEKSKSVKEGRAVMKFVFTRSGGFAGSATAIRGEVRFDRDSARVTSDFGYERELSIDEIQQIREALVQLPKSQSSGRPLPDQYQYDIQITADDGQVQTVTLHGDSSPQAKKILDWVREECSRIWAQRMKQAGD